MKASGYDPATLLVGVLGRPHGLRGELMLRPYNQHGPDGVDIEAVGSVLVDGPRGRREYPVRAARRVQGGWLVRLEGVDTREAAAALTQGEVRLPRAALPPLGPGEFYVEDVVGCSVRGEGARALGVVEELFWNGDHDVMIVRDGDRERMVPLLPQFIQSVDAGAREVVVSWQDEDEDESEGKGGTGAEGADDDG